MIRHERETLVGFGVVRSAPHYWHFAGLYATREEAEARAAELGEAYEVRYGRQPAGTQYFSWEPEP